STAIVPGLYREPDRVVVPVRVPGEVLAPHIERERAPVLESPDRGRVRCPSSGREGVPRSTVRHPRRRRVPARRGLVRLQGKGRGGRAGRKGPRRRTVAPSRRRGVAPLLPASEASGETARMAASSTKPATATATIRSPRHFTVFMGAASLARYRLSVSTLFRISPETRPTARDLRECLGTPSAAKSAHAEPCRASAQSRLIVVATSARLPSGSASVHQAGLVPFDEARHLPKAFNGLAGSVRLTTGYGSADDSAEEPLPFIPGTRKDFDPGVDEELHRD